MAPFLTAPRHPHFPMNLRGVDVSSSENAPRDCETDTGNEDNSNHQMNKFSSHGKSMPGESVTILCFLAHLCHSEGCSCIRDFFGHAAAGCLLRAFIHQHCMPCAGSVCHGVLVLGSTCVGLFSCFCVTKFKSWVMHGV
jgi:hypothetical protein